MAVEGVGLPFPEAERFFRQKVNLPTERSDDLRHGAHVRAFSVAGMVRDDMLADVRTAMNRSMTEGRPYSEFKAAFDEMVDRTGWQFNAPGSTEEGRREWRARIIYRTNMRVAYMAGRYAQMTDPDVLAYRPYWRYRHNHVLHPRPLHLAWDGTILLATDPWWKTHYGPNGWGCQCDVVALSRRQLRALGKDGPDPTPDLGAYQALDPRTGEPITRYRGIDRGWEYNPGESWLHGTVPTELAEPLPPAPPPTVKGEVAPQPKPRPDLPPMPPARPTQAKLLPADQPLEDYARAFLEPFGATLEQGTLFRDASGGLIAIDRSLFEARNKSGEVLGLKADKRGRGRFMALLAEALRDPDEIWVDWAQVASGVVLRRSYLRHTRDEAGNIFFARFEWTSRGWIGVTTYTATEEVLRLRLGALLFRRQ